MTDPAPLLPASPHVSWSPGREPCPEELLPRGQAVPVVVLLGAEEDREWTAAAAVEMAECWAQAGNKVVLMDLHLQDPRLHAAVGQQNLDGVVDVFLYGASLARTARPVPGRGFFLISAGTYTAEIDALWRHPRWERVVAGFAEAGATLLVFAPPEALDLVEHLSPPPEIVVLGGGRVLPLPALPRAVVTPTRHAVPLGPGEETTLEGGMAPGRLTEPPPVLVGASGGAEIPPLPATRRHRGISPLVWAVLAAAALGVLGWLFFRSNPELLARWAGPPAARQTLGLPSSTLSKAGAPARPLGTPLPFSVQVAAFNSLSAAREVLAADQRRVPDAAFFVSPERQVGILYYKVLAGAVADTGEAAALRDRLVQAEVIDSAEVAGGGWSLVRSAPLAFRLADYATQAEALQRADSLAAAGLPVYSLAVPFSDGSERWVLYAGAYGDSASASAMRELLAGTGVSGELAPRIGRGADPAP